MFIKSLKIYNDKGIIREIGFHEGLNLIVDDTPESGTGTGNNVGKTTVLRLIDFCLGKDQREIYADPENIKEEYKIVKDFLTDTEVFVELTLTSDFDHENVVIRRNFLKNSSAIREINGIQYKDKEFELALEHTILDINIEKPTFRQIISHNIRYSTQSLSHTLKTLPFGKDTEYETLYLYMFGCDFNDGKIRQEKYELLKTERNFKLRLEKVQSKSAYKSMLGIVKKQIEELNSQKESLNINPNFELDLNALSQLKYQINAISSEINSLNIKKSIIAEAQQDMSAQKTNIDVEQLENIYNQAKLLMPDLHKAFSDLVAYHNQMVEEKVKFLMSELPTIEQSIYEKDEKLHDLLNQENVLSQKVIKSDTYEDLEDLISDLNENYRKKGEYENVISQIDDCEKTIFDTENELDNIDKSLFSDEFKEQVQYQIDKFNVFFSSVSRRLYNEEYVIKGEPELNKKTNKYIYKFSSFNANLSTGKKQGEISCFDIAYTLFADDNDIPCLHFILNDKKELMHGNQLTDIADLVGEKNIQFVASILKDKLPEKLNSHNYIIVELSCDNKLFRIENS